MKPGSATSTFNQHAQPSGVPAHGLPTGGSTATGPDAVVLGLHARLCELVPDADERAGLLKVPANVDAAWLEGRMLPVLRAQRKPLQTIVARLERERLSAT
jgi:hypothetical protein